MKYIDITKIVGTVAISLTLIGCGGGSSGETISAPPVVEPAPPVTEDPNIIDSGNTGEAFRTETFSFIGTYYYYSAPDCLYGTGSFNYEVYADNTVKIVTSRGTVTECSLEKKFEPNKNVADGVIDATYLNSYGFYDNTTKIYYDTDSFNNPSLSLVEIINDGQTAVADNGDSEVLRYVYKEIALTY